MIPSMHQPSTPGTTAAHAFIAKWSGITASELATAQSFVIELCALLDVAPPSHEPHYQFERPITFHHGDGSTSPGRVDCYKRGHFVWESKKLKAGLAAQTRGNATTKAFDDALLKEAMEVTGLPTKKATVEEALRRLVKNAELRQVISDMRGLGWEGDLDEMRTDRPADHRS